MKHLSEQDYNMTTNHSEQGPRLSQMNEDRIRHLEMHIEERTADLAAALVARDEFLMIASHELKTPLTSLKLRLQMGKRNLRDDINKLPTKEDLEKLYTQSLEQVDTLVNLIEDLLDVSRIQSGKLTLNKKAVNLSDLVSKVVERFKGQHTKTELALNLTPDIVIKADAYRMEQVVSNLIMNAIKYAPGTPVDIHLTLCEKKENLVLTVKDYGPGIEKDKQGQIFDRYERLSSYQHNAGMGLGLFIVKNIVQGHNGNVTLESAPGEGASFKIHLPL